MSYDVTLTLDGGNESAEVFWRNHTSNTAVMWREAGCDIAEYHGASAGVLGLALSRAVRDIEERPDHYARWNPPNGWGSVETTLEFLRDLLNACRRYPAATVDVSR